MFTLFIFFLSMCPAAKHGGGRGIMRRKMGAEGSPLNPRRAERWEAAGETHGQGGDTAADRSKRTAKYIERRALWIEVCYWESALSVGGRVSGETNRHGGVVFLLLKFKWISRHAVWLSLFRLNWGSRDKRGNIIIPSLSPSLPNSHYINTLRAHISTMVCATAAKASLPSRGAPVRDEHTPKLGRAAEQWKRAFLLLIGHRLYEISTVMDGLIAHQPKHQKQSIA